RFQQDGIKPNAVIINDMKEGSSYYPYYGYAYNRSDMEPKNDSMLMAGYQAVGDWLGKRQAPDYLPVLEPIEEAEDKVQA
ncbi:MAG: hypothetical protein Q8S55_02550, partial [Methylococcaceae bacterium]|nr:hypothetical protein [Methylococcaceae bacterium]